MPIQKHLLKNHFNNIIRVIRKSEVERVMVLRTATYNALKALKVKRDTSKAVSKLPPGSDQTDLMSVIRWIDKIAPGDTEAIQQLVRIDATAVVRTST